MHQSNPEHALKHGKRAIGCLQEAMSITHTAEMAVHQAQRLLKMLLDDDCNIVTALQAIHETGERPYHLRLDRYEEADKACEEAIAAIKAVHNAAYAANMNVVSTNFIIQNTVKHNSDFDAAQVQRGSQNRESSGFYYNPWDSGNYDPYDDIRRVPDDGQSGNFECDPTAR